MSYDFYCYRSSSGVPSAAEAEAFVEAANAAEETGTDNTTASGTKEKLTTALLQHNPRLEAFQFNFAGIAESQKISEEEARSRYQHIELNPPEGDLAIQLTISDNQVFISIPYWYTGDAAAKVFSQCSEYLRVIRRTAGFLAYDPQTGSAFDPEQTGLTDQEQYEKTVRGLPAITAQAKRKAWWKFW